jgi:tetratricopeptide (TPR) repeat protein
MVYPGSRLISWTRLALALVLGAPACQSAMSVEEAKKVSASFGGAAFVPPPRTINDITAILDQQKRTTPEVVFREQANDVPPTTTDRDTLAAFYFKRGLAAREIGRIKQEIADLTKAAEYAGPRDSPAVYSALSKAEEEGGNFSRALEYRRRKTIEGGLSWNWQFTFYADLVISEAGRGDVKAAEAALSEASRLYYQLLRLETRPSNRYPYFAKAQAALLEATGKYTEAEALWRRAERPTGSGWGTA